MARPENPKRLRELRCMERFMSDLHEKKMYFGTILTGSYVVPDSLVKQEAESELRDIIEYAVARTVLHQPCLQVGIAGDGPGTPDSHYVELDCIDLAQQIVWRYVSAYGSLSDEFRDVVENELDKSFADRNTRPPWKVIALRQRGTNQLYLVFNFHHVITDGTGAKIFHQQVLQHLNKPGNDGLAEVLDGHILTPAALKFPPSQDNMTAYPFTLGFRLKELWDSRKPAFLRDISATAVWAPFNMKSYKTVFRRLVVTQSTLQRILSVCRENKTTLTGLMHAIILLSLSSRLQASGFIACTPNNMRPHTPATKDFSPDEAIGVIVSCISHCFSAATVAEAKQLSAKRSNKEQLARFLFSAAAKARTEIKEGVDAGTTNNMIGQQARKTDFLATINARFGKPRETSWMVTNLGVLDGEGAPGEWSIDDAFFTVCAERTGAAIIVSLVAVKSGNLCIDVSWQEGVVDSEVGEGIVSDTERWFTYFARGESA